MRTRTVVLAIAMVIVAAGCDWLQWANGPGHPGSGYEPGITAAALADLSPSTMATTPPSTPPVTFNGLVIVARDGLLTAYDSRTSSVVWTGALPAGSTSGTAPAVDTMTKTVYVVVATGGGPELVGFDANGQRNCNPWFFTCTPTFHASLGSTAGPATPPIVFAGKVLVSAAGVVAAFDAGATTNCATAARLAECTPLWTTPTGANRSGVGPAARGQLVYAAVDGTSGPGVGAFDLASGAPAWTGPTNGPVTSTPSLTGDTHVVVTTPDRIDVYPGNGCGQATCSPDSVLVPASGSPDGAFLGTASIDGGRIHATRSDGSLLTWPAAGCGAGPCEPTYSRAVDEPDGGTATYAQSPVLANGTLFLLGRQSESSSDHLVLFALDPSNGSERAHWDLGVSGFGPGIANPAVAWGIVYVPTADGFVAVHPSAIEPLAALGTTGLSLSPSFSSSTSDYVLRCAAGANAVTLTATAVDGGSVRLVAPVTTDPAVSLSQDLSLTENQAAVVQAADARGRTRQYWIRCLPHDFPELTTTRHPENGNPNPGWYLVGTNFAANTLGHFAMVLDTNGTPVWYRRTDAGPTNVTYLGPNTIGYYTGAHFEIHSLVTGAERDVDMVGIPSDQHEFAPTPNGNSLMVSYAQTTGVDLTGLPNASPPAGANQTIIDCTVQELDPAGQLVWQWKASDHVDPVSETTSPSPTGTGDTRLWDVFHCNSADASPDGSLVLVSLRNTNAIFAIDRATGHVVWKMGGTPTNKDGAAIVAVQNDPQGTFALQHDARWMPNGDISVYDNQRPGSGKAARGIEYALDLGENTATPVFSYRLPEGIAACCQGSFRLLPDGHRIVGWGWLQGNARMFTELDDQGRSVLDVALPVGMNASYRAVKVPPPRFDIDVLHRTAGQGG